MSIDHRRQFQNVRGLTKSGGQCRRADREDLLLEQQFRSHAGPASSPDADAEIDIGGLQIGERRGRVDPQPDIRMMLGEAVQPVDEPARRKDRRADTVNTDSSGGVPARLPRRVP